ncbi:MAG: hypothetical protein U0326_44655 [Polyangiales bacterium]
MTKRSPPRAAAPAERPATADLEALYDAVYASPDDDAPRSALAAALTAQGDPRGELIARQLAPLDQRDLTREAKLVAKHQKLWLGELAPAVRYKTPVYCGPTRGYSDMHIGVRWDRGFVAGINLDLSDTRMKKLAALPAWSTVEFVLFGRSETADPAATRALLGAMHGLRGLAGHRALLEAAADTPAVRARLTTLHAWLWRDADAPATMTALCERFPKLRRLAFVYTDDVAPLVASPLFARLEEMYLGSTLTPITVRREGDDLHLTVVGYNGPVEPWVFVVLDALPAAQVASLSLTGRDVSKGHYALAKRFPRVREAVYQGERPRVL